jgi:RecA/RadA recombinase
MFFADKESGKTGQGLTWGANWQKHFGEKGWVVVYDAEGRLTEKKIRMSGVDKSRLIVIKSNASEFVLQNILDLINNNPEGLKYFFIVDSINALTTADERGKTLSEAEARAGVARVNSMAFKKLSLPIHVKGHHLYLCSQIRAGNMTGFGGAGNKAGGGMAWDGNSPRYIKEGEKVVGRYTEFDFRKTYNETTGSKLAVPIKYNHTGGVWKANEVVDMALAWGLVIKKGSWYSIQSELFKESAEKAGISPTLLGGSVQGHFGFVNFLEENPDLQKMIYSYILEMLK